jgi:hypothetical protein
MENHPSQNRKQISVYKVVKNADCACLPWVLGAKQQRQGKFCVCFQYNNSRKKLTKCEFGEFTSVKKSTQLLLARLKI